MSIKRLHHNTVKQQLAASGTNIQSMKGNIMKATKTTPEALNLMYQGIKALVEQRGEVEQDLCAQRQTAWDVHHAALIRMAEGTATADDVTIVNLIREADEETGRTVTSATTPNGATFKQLFSADKSGQWRCKPSIVGKAETIEAVKNLRNPWVKYDDAKAPKSEFEKAGQALRTAEKFGEKFSGMFPAKELAAFQTAVAALIKSHVAYGHAEASLGAAEPPSAAVASLPTLASTEKAA